MTPTPLPPDPLASVESSIAALDEIPLEEQAAAFEEIHRVVTQVLASTAQPDAAPASAEQ